MRVTRDPEELRAWSKCYRRAGLSIGFVPTLGGLHAGHLSLMRRARSECDRVLVSIYLNPTQFNSRADLESYPSTEDADLEASSRERVDLVYLGRREDLLPDGFQSWVEVERLTGPLCGASRPGHFRGVTTVVVQLLNLSRPHRAYFGLKDFQQARVIQRMVRDLAFDLEIRLAPTIREEDGLAASSRNKLLSPGDRTAAPALYRALEATRQRIVSGETSVPALEGFLRRTLAREPRLEVDYAAILDGESLEPFPSNRVPAGAERSRSGGVLIAAAAYVGGTRLIDNVWLPPGGGDAAGGVSSGAS